MRLLAILQTDLELYPDCQRVSTAAHRRSELRRNLVVDGVANDGSECIRDLERWSVARSRALVDDRIGRDCGPNSRDATLATAMARDSSPPSLAIVADVPMQIGALVAAQPVAHPPHQHRDVGALAAAICVQFVENEEIQTLAHWR